MPWRSICPACGSPSWGPSRFAPQPLRASSRLPPPSDFRPRPSFRAMGWPNARLFVDGIQGTLAGTVRRFDAQALKEGKAAAGKERVLVACGMRDGESETSVVIADPDVETVLPDGSIGEVCVSGPGVAAGYWGREAETAAVFDRPIAGAPGHYMRTGDLGFYHEGKLFITGRRDDLIILNGVNHHPQDIEATAASTHLGAVGLARRRRRRRGCRSLPCDRADRNSPRGALFARSGKADRLDPGGGVRRP